MVRASPIVALLCIVFLQQPMPLDAVRTQHDAAKHRHTSESNSTVALTLEATLAKEKADYRAERAAAIAQGTLSEEATSTGCWMMKVCCHDVKGGTRCKTPDEYTETCQRQICYSRAPFSGSDCYDMVQVTDDQCSKWNAFN
eukprot:TRINITY_DN14505_c0_g2_i1.p1 TRINITY_DN14505_c0_g2~~TRINITY_DN14505_c0_g2_i1.p1  ORF type:complete len:142 (-),score=25.04 TRINITY_DN14505_c0_g2_i1:215-640(-)